MERSRYDCAEERKCCFVPGGPAKGNTFQSKAQTDSYSGCLR